jgi:2-succinyl-6-hydroxy-2,4-cyclohexadiene-1-carboxylate synthase
MAKPLIYALHGFLGTPADWKSVVARTPEFDFVCGELFGNSDFAWPDFSDRKSKKIFLGYSLGGRLGLQLLSRYPESFDHFVFLSTNPGFTDAEFNERRKRVEADRLWADKIEASTWNQFIREWNSQPIFYTGTVEPERAAHAFNLQKLKLALTEHSLGLQDDYRELIRTNRNRIKWVVGSRDQKYLDLAESLDMDVTVVDSGHRIIWDNPEAVANILKNI